MHTPGGEIWQGIAGPGVNLQKLRQAKQNTAVVLEGKRGSEGWRQRPEYVLRSGAGTEEEQQPRDLEVWDRWKDLEEGTMLCGKGLKIRSDILVRTEGSSKDPQPAFIRRQAGVTYPRALRLGDRGKVGGLDAAGIPHTGLRGIEMYVSMLEQVDFEAAQQVGSPFRRAGQVYVIEECPNAFARQGVGLWRARRAGARPRANNAGMSGSPRSPPSAWRMLCGMPASSIHTNSDADP